MNNKTNDNNRETYSQNKAFFSPPPNIFLFKVCATMVATKLGN